MKRARFIGGLILIGAAALIFFANWDVPVPVPIALVATSRRMR